jgi:pheromone a factor receptor
MVASNRNPNQNRYIRLIALSCTQVILTLPLHCYQIYYSSILIRVQPWISWASTHSHYSHVGQFPSIIWRATPTAEASLEINRWIIVSSAFVFFAFFGFAEEARKHYRLAYTVATQRLHLSGFSISRSSTRSLTSSFGPGLRKGAAASVGSSLRSYNWPGTMKERDVSTVVSDRRLTSDSSIFEDAHDEPKAVGLLPDEDDFHPAPAAQTAVIVLPTISRAPVLPSPTASSGGAVLSIPPDRINSPLPHRPMSSYRPV